MVKRLLHWLFPDIRSAKKSQESFIAAVNGAVDAMHKSDATTKELVVLRQKVRKIDARSTRKP